MGKEVFVEVKNLVKTYVKGGVLGRKRVVKAVEGVSFAIGKGETLGLVGESGSGKTTIGRILAGLERADSGEVLIDGTPLPKFLRKNRIKIQLIFQNPDTSLDPRQRVKDVIGEALEAAGRSRSEDAIKEILHDVGLPPEVMERYPHELSGGQKERVAIARAISVYPDFIIADEIISALDATIKVRILRLIKKLQEEHGFSMLFISHDLPMTASVSDKIAVIYAGRIMEYGKAWEVMHVPLHPYTAHLVSSVPKLYFRGGWKPQGLRMLEGTPPDNYEGCPLFSRCPRATPGLCNAKPPSPLSINGRLVSCHNPLNVRIRKGLTGEEGVNVLSR